MVHNVVHLQLRARRQLYPRGDVRSRPCLLKMPLGHLVLQGLPWPLCTPLKFHNFGSSKGCPSPSEHYQDQPKTKGSTICQPAKDNSSTQENNHSTNNHNDHLSSNNKEGDSQANNNSENEG